MLDLVLLVLAYVGAAALGCLLLYCALTNLGPLELVAHLAGRWKNRNMFEGEPIPQAERRRLGRR